MENEISYKIIGAAIEVHRVLGGCGLLENIYEHCLCNELKLQGLKIERQKPIPIAYKGSVIKDPLFIDLLVEDSIIVEVKATELNHPIHEVQLLTYLRLSNKKLGILINFGQEYVKEGIKRVVNKI